MIQDIRIDVRWRNHPKRAKLAFLLGHDATGYVLDLWISTAQSKPDGVLRGLDEMDIALMAGWRGSPADFVAALQATRLLERNETQNCWQLHDWHEHQPWVIGEPERVARAKKAINARWEKAKEGQEKDAEGLGRAAPAVRKMPEVGQKNGENVLGEYCENTGRIQEVILEPQSSNTPLQCLSSPKGRKTPPEEDKSSSAPTGGEGKPSKTKKFMKPSIEDVRAYCEERGNGIDAEAFWNFYESKGWKVGKTPMASWKSAVVTWEKQRKGAAVAATKPLSPAEKLLAETAGGTAQ